MPLIEIDLPRAVYAEHRDAIGDVVQRAQRDALGVPMEDVFRIFRPHDDGELVFDPGYGGVDRRALTVIRITPVRIYRVTEKQALFRAIVLGLEELGMRRQDVLILIGENGWEDWFAGRLGDEDEQVEA